MVGGGKIFESKDITTIKEKVKEIEVSFNLLTLDEKKVFSKLHGAHMEGILRVKYGNKT